MVFQLLINPVVPWMKYCTKWIKNGRTLQAHFWATQLSNQVRLHIFYFSAAELQHVFAINPTQVPGSIKRICLCKSKKRTYPELLRSRRCRLVVVAIETEGRWNPEATTFLRLRAHAKARRAADILRRGVEAFLFSHWQPLRAQAAHHAFVSGLLDLGWAVHKENS